MARIRTYALDNNVTGSDYWIGTDGNDNSNTKNFSPNSVAQYLNENEIIDVSNSVRFKYDTIDSGQQRKDGTISFQNEIGATVPMSDLSSFVLSKKTQSGKDVSFFLNVLPTTKVILHKSNDINIFGLYRVLSVTTDLVEPNFFNVSLEFISGHGSIEEDKDYIISLIDINKTIPVLQLTKETFNYVSSGSFTLSNTIGNILQVIINTTSLHPEGYSYTLPSTVTILNELHAGDVITVVYNYLEEFLEVPNLQKVTNIGNHTTNNIIIDNIPGEWGSYTASNTLNELGAFQSFTSPTSSPDYQTTYAGYEMSISEIYTPIERKEALIYSGIVQASYINGSNYNALRLNSGDNSNGPSFYIEKNNINGQLRIDNLIGNTILQFPAKPTGTYTIATTLDIPAPLPQATASVSGYLSSTDWTTFNGKANVNSQVFTGTPSLPTGTIGVTQTDGTNNTTLATTAFATTVVANKMDKPSLTASYIPKALTATTIGNSRLLDTGTYLGIGTVNAPTKDITLGYQFNREIGIELSDSTTVGRDFTLMAGTTVNYSLNTNFTALNQTSRDWRAVAINNINGDVYAADYSNGDIYKQTAGAGTFIGLGLIGRSWIGLAVNSTNSDVYALVDGGDIYKQTAGAGTFNALGQTSRAWRAIAINNTTSDVYATVDNGDIYKQTAGAGTFVGLSQTSRPWWGITVNSITNDIYVSTRGGDIYKQTAGAGTFNALGQTSRDYRHMAVNPTTSIVYVVVANGDIYSQTGGTGTFIGLGQTSRLWWGIAVNSINNNVYATVNSGGDIYEQINYAPGAPDLQGGTLKLNSGTGKGTGASDIEMWTGQVLASGTDMQTATLRAKINNTGLMTLPSVTNALIEADTTGKAVVTKEYVNNKLSTYKTYFINTATGNNTTGVYQDANKPFASIDYVNSNFTITDGDIFYLQGTGQTYAINNQLQTASQSFIADDTSTNTLDFSSNSNTNIAVTQSVKRYVINITMRNGIIINNRSGGTGVNLNGLASYFTLKLDVREIYWNTSTLMYSMNSILPRGVFKVPIISCAKVLTNFWSEYLHIRSFTCLSTNAMLLQTQSNAHKCNIRIDSINGAGSYLFGTNDNYLIGDISTTVACVFDTTWGQESYITFNNSVITGGGILLPSMANNLVLSGVIRSVTSFTNSTTTSAIFKFINFTADFGTNKLNVNGTSTISFENCSIKSTNSPLGVVTNVSGGNFIIKNSSFEVVNAVPLMTGGAGGTRTLTINGLSTNATTLSDQNGTGVTVSVIGKQVVADGVDSKDAVNKGQVDNRLVVETASGYTLTNADSGGIVIFTASATLTIPTGLANGFECTFVTLAGATLTVVSTGNTLNNASGSTMAAGLSFTLKRMLAANTYIATGDL